MTTLSFSPLSYLVEERDGVTLHQKKPPMDALPRPSRMECFEFSDLVGEVPNIPLEMEPLQSYADAHSIMTSPYPKATQVCSCSAPNERTYPYTNAAL